MFKKFFIFLIKVYKAMISPILGANCRYTPSCSQYCIEAINEWGVIKGVFLGLKRIGRCHPWGSSGYDPIPKKNNRKN